MLFSKTPTFDPFKAGGRKGNMSVRKALALKGEADLFSSHEIHRIIPLEFEVPLDYVRFHLGVMLSNGEIVPKNLPEPETIPPLADEVPVNEFGALSLGPDVATASKGSGTTEVPTASTPATEVTEATPTTTGAIPTPAKKKWVFKGLVRDRLDYKAVQEAIRIALASGLSVNHIRNAVETVLSEFIEKPAGGSN